MDCTRSGYGRFWSDCVCLHWERCQLSLHAQRVASVRRVLHPSCTSSWQSRLGAQWNKLACEWMLNFFRAVSIKSAKLFQSFPEWRPLNGFHFNVFMFSSLIIYNNFDDMTSPTNGYPWLHCYAALIIFQFFHSLAFTIFRRRSHRRLVCRLLVAWMFLEN